MSSSSSQKVGKGTESGMGDRNSGGDVIAQNVHHGDGGGGGDVIAQNMHHGEAGSGGDVIAQNVTPAMVTVAAM